MRHLAVFNVASVFLILLSPAAKGQTLNSIKTDLKLTIHCPATDIKQGDEIPIVFTITNKGESIHSFYDRDRDRSGRVGEYRLSAKDEDGKRVIDPKERYGDRGMFGGGPSYLKEINPGESFSKTVALNQWALIKDAGRYVVSATYETTLPTLLIGEDGQRSGYGHEDNQPYRSLYRTTSGYGGGAPRVVLQSAPIEIEVKARSNEEMGECIRKLSGKIDAARAQDRKGREHVRKYWTLMTPSEKSMLGRNTERIIKKLMFTCDLRIVPVLVDVMYEEELRFWASEAIVCYLPRDTKTKASILEVARKRGLPLCLQYPLEKLGCTEQEFKEIIPISLDSSDPNVVRAGALAAGTYPDDAFVSQLIRIATEGEYLTRYSAISALSGSRNDEAVKTLEALLRDPDKDIRERTSLSILNAYLDEPVDSEYGDSERIPGLITGAIDLENRVVASRVIYPIIFASTRAEIRAFKALLEDPDADIPEAKTIESVRVFRQLLRDANDTVRRVVGEIVGDFPDERFPLTEAEFREENKGRKARVLGWLRQISSVGTVRTRSWARLMKLAGVENFHKVSDELYRGAQPSDKGMRELEKLGTKTIVNLRSFHSDRGEIKGTDLAYEHIYMKAWHAEDKEVVRFLKIVSDKEHTPVFVHCMHGADRTGTMCAIYRIAIQGWSKAEAIEEMTKGGFGFHSVWENLPEYLEELDIEEMKRQAGLEN